MRSIVYAGNDFSDFSTAEVVARSANPIIAEFMRVPGRAGALLVSGYVPPVDVTVRLFMDPGYKPSAGGLAQLRAKIRSWLCWPGGGNLMLPDDPEVEYVDAMLVGASDWSDLFEAGSCELTFTLFDPIGYGMERVETGPDFVVGGDWPTLPEFSITAYGGAYVELGYIGHGRGIRVEGPFVSGDVIAIDCAGEAVTVNGVDARDRVPLGSDFFAFEPGEAHISCLGFFEVETRFTERWA